MKQATKPRLIQLSLSLVVFSASWLALVRIGSVLVDEAAVVNWLAKNDWIQLLSPNIRDTLIGASWQPTAALIFAVGAYPLLKTPAAFLARRFFKRSNLLQLNWTPPAFGLPRTEFLFILPSYSHDCSLILKNTGSEPTRVHRIELEGRIYRDILRNDGTCIAREEVLLVTLASEGRNKIGLEWTKKEEKIWVIDIPFTLRENEELLLPALGPIIEDSTKNAAIEAQNLVGLSTITVNFDVWLDAKRETTTASLSAPLRFLLSAEQGGDGGVDSLLNGLGIKEEKERNSLRDAYQNVREIDFGLRRQIEGTFRETQEAQEAADNATTARGA
jgi:hypothetical protein